jgi:hypothetical protein
MNKIISTSTILSTIIVVFLQLIIWNFIIL